MLNQSHTGRRTAGIVRQFRSFDNNVRMLLINEFSISAGFFMLMPYLAVYLSEKMALAGWAVGLVVGIRNFSQQGMFLVGGTCTDRFGYKKPIMLGCALRAVGFAMLGLGTSLTLLVAGSLVSGFAGALFLPAVRVGIAEAAGPRRLEAFALCNLCNRLGIVVGRCWGWR